VTITQQTFAYTNTRCCPKPWSVAHLGIRQGAAAASGNHLRDQREISGCHAHRYFGDEARIARLSLIDESGGRYVRMAHLACVGSHAINGVADLHTQLLKQDVLKDFYELWPESSANKTNGVTPRRWLALTNPRLGELICDAIGDGWSRPGGPERPGEIRGRPGFQADCARDQTLQQARAGGNRAQPHRRGDRSGPCSIVQVKRIHEYKRQHLNILHVIALYHRLKSDSSFDIHRDLHLRRQGGSGYHIAKLIIKLINSVGDVVNRDPQIRDRLKVVFLPFQRHQRAARVPCGRPVRADFHCRQGGLRHRQHEILA